MSLRHKFDENIKYNSKLLIITEATFGFCETMQYCKSRCKLSENTQNKISQPSSSTEWMTIDKWKKSMVAKDFNAKFLLQYYTLIKFLLHTSCRKNPILGREVVIEPFPYLTVYVSGKRNRST